MAGLRVVSPLRMLMILTLLSWSQSMPPPQECHEEIKDVSETLNRNKRAVGILTILGLSVTLGSTLHGGICSFSNICGSSSLSEQLDDLNVKLDDIEGDLLSLQSDVADIWQELRKSWYLDQIMYANHLRKDLKTLPMKKKQRNAFHKLKRQRFLNEVLGDNGNDKNVLEALYHIPRLVREEGLIEQYLRTQKRKHQSEPRKALKKTWKFIKNLFKIQNVGYGYVMIAYGLKYRNKRKSEKLQSKIDACKGQEALALKCSKYEKKLRKIKKDRKAYKQAISIVCATWKTTSDPKYMNTCSKLKIAHPHLKDRRKPQQDYIFDIIELFQYPALQVEVNCKTKDSKGLAFAPGDHSNEFWGYDTSNAKLTKYDRVTDTISTIDLTNECSERGSSPCHPIDVSVSGRTNNDFRIAVITREHYLLQYKLDQSGQLVLQCKKWISDTDYKGRLRSVVICGDLFGYLTVMGWIKLFKRDCTNLETPAKQWKLYEYGARKGFLRCSNDREMLLVQSQLNPSAIGTGNFWGFAAINLAKAGHNENIQTTSSIESEAQIVVKYDDFLPWHTEDYKSRIDAMAGMGLSKDNFFMTSGPKGSYTEGTTGTSVGGVYQRLPSGKLRVIREYPKNKLVAFHDLAVDENGFVYSENQHWISNQRFADKCVHKYIPDIDFENAKLKWSENE